MIINSILLSIKNSMYFLSPITYDNEEGKSLGYLRIINKLFFKFFFDIVEVTLMSMAIEL